jgi:hypothetical protein
MLRPSLAAYFREIDYYKNMYYLGTAYYGDGKARPARFFWLALSRQPDAGEWRSRALTQLQGPVLESAVEMP